tara:strand:+ start:598 stop:810 length:213 start_codon:yes stop_codon:yes gene_type:complete
MIQPKHKNYFTVAMNFAIMKLTNTSFKDYNNLSIKEIVSLSKNLSEEILIRQKGVGRTSIQKLNVLRSYK